ncbi:carbonic anhydrase [Annulohypoxylon maeteangense]|uniref:carbonic anhydrase n=1 Tax=Annulohypoxylon maeteangense TaxID=1927788 RepID=UPI002008AAFE|nr:carbonic anhydrase [Annulohypoxylon maeteangense]KAI0883892.1 carbonic anhydrase [Annulohypoxylon maeteangense]
MSSSFSRLFLLAASVTSVMASCGSLTHLFPRAEGEEVPISKFGYTGTTGPVLWTQLDTAANGLCSTGSNQSPINMVEGQFKLIPASDTQLTIPDVPEGAEFENLGSTVEVVMKGLGGTFVLEGKTYTLEQFHFHHPSEHIDNGVSLPMEMHLVFSSGTDIGVIGVYVDLIDVPQKTFRVHLVPRQTPSTLLETIFSSVGEIATPGTKTKTKPLVMSELVNTLKAGNFQRYTGSLTTPPCSEGVAWSVATQKLMLSRTTFQAARDIIGFNSRFPQNNLGAQNVLTLASGAAGAVAKAPATEQAANVTSVHRRWMGRGAKLE